LRHPLEEHVAIGQVLELLSQESMSRP
jgi:hypothetical protein